MRIFDELPKVIDLQDIENGKIKEYPDIICVSLCDSEFFIDSDDEFRYYEVVWFDIGNYEKGFDMEDFEETEFIAVRKGGV